MSGRVKAKSSGRSTQIKKEPMSRFYRRVSRSLKLSKIMKVRRKLEVGRSVGKRKLKQKDVQFL